jgi:hypothetical protein
VAVGVQIKSVGETVGVGLSIIIIIIHSIHLLSAHFPPHYHVFVVIINSHASLAIIPPYVVTKNV